MPRNKKLVTTAAAAKKSHDGQVIRLIVLFGSLILILIIFSLRHHLLSLTRLGYIGIFFVNLLSSATVVFPIPGVASVVVGGALFNPVFVGIFSGVGAGLGELTGYFMGYGGRGLLRNQKQRLERIEYFFHLAGFWGILLFASIPFPFDFVGLLAGSLNYPVWKFAVATITGRILRNTIIAITGAKFVPL